MKTEVSSGRIEFSTNEFSTTLVALGIWMSRMEPAVFSRRSTAMATPVLPTPRPFRPGR